jgi:hypothetical protein
MRLLSILRHAFQIVATLLLPAETGKLETHKQLCSDLVVLVGIMMGG